MFSAADAGKVNADDADTGLTETEFTTSINIDKLKEVLEPVAFLNVSWILTMEGSQQVQAEKVFAVLDADCSKHILIREFIEVLKGSKGKLMG